MPFVRDYSSAYESVTSDAGITIPMCAYQQNDLLLVFAMRDLQVAQEALNGIREAAREGAREALEAAKARIVPADLHESLPDELPEVEARGKIEPLSPVNDLVSRVTAITDTQSVFVLSRETQTNDDDDALALIMILAEMD